MSLDGVFIDRRHGIAALDYWLVYAVVTPLHAQLYAHGLIQRIKWFLPSADPVEYRPGVVHIPLEDWNHYRTIVASCLEQPGSYELRTRTAAEMTASIRRVARANWRIEREPTPDGLLALLEAAVGAMRFYNFNDETCLPDIIGQWLNSETSRVLLSFALSPVVTPYMVLLAQRASACWHEPTPRNLRRFGNGASFLCQFDCLADVEVAAGELRALAGRFASDRMTLRSDPRHAKKRRAEAIARLMSLTAGWPTEDQAKLRELVTLACAAADHEEARHYWQARTLRNIRRFCARFAVDPRQVTMDGVVHFAG